MKDQDYKYTMEFRVENMTIDQVTKLRSILDTMKELVKEKEFTKLLKSQSERTSI